MNIARITGPIKTAANKAGKSVVAAGRHVLENKKAYATGAAGVVVVGTGVGVAVQHGEKKGIKA